MLILDTSVPDKERGRSASENIAKNNRFGKVAVSFADDSSISARQIVTLLAKAAYPGDYGLGEFEFRQWGMSRKVFRPALNELILAGFISRFQVYAIRNGKKRVAPSTKHRSLIKEPTSRFARVKAAEAETLATQDGGGYVRIAVLFYIRAIPSANVDIIAKRFSLHERTVRRHLDGIRRAGLLPPAFDLKKSAGTKSACTKGVVPLDSGEIPKNQQETEVAYVTADAATTRAPPGEIEPLPREDNNTTANPETARPEFVDHLTDWKTAAKVGEISIDGSNVREVLAAARELKVLGQDIPSVVWARVLKAQSVTNHPHLEGHYAVRQAVEISTVINATLDAAIGDGDSEFGLLEDFMNALAYAVSRKLNHGATIRSLAVVAIPMIRRALVGDTSFLDAIPATGVSDPQDAAATARELSSLAATRMSVDDRWLQLPRAAAELDRLIAHYGDDAVIAAVNTCPPPKEGLVVRRWSYFAKNLLAGTATVKAPAPAAAEKTRKPRDGTPQQIDFVRFAIQGMKLEDALMFAYPSTPSFAVPVQLDRLLSSPFVRSALANSLPTQDKTQTS